MELKVVLRSTKYGCNLFTFRMAGVIQMAQPVPFYGKLFSPHWLKSSNEGFNAGRTWAMLNKPKSSKPVKQDLLIKYPYF
ncbi:MAG: hypothetical protein IEMM0006_1880 [bacterium]|nr:MAG: hypothetical protein IEMM0006_1880 [bacterium]